MLGMKTVDVGNIKSDSNGICLSGTQLKKWNFEQRNFRIDTNERT